MEIAGRYFNPGCLKNFPKVTWSFISRTPLINVLIFLLIENSNTERYCIN